MAGASAYGAVAVARLAIGRAAIKRLEIAELEVGRLTGGARTVPVQSGRRGRVAMEYRTLGRTGVTVTPLCLGAMMFGAWGNPDHDDSIRIIHRALHEGNNLIDTADVYSRGELEEIVGKAIARGRRDDAVLATKFYGGMGDDPNERGGSRRWIVREVENSLRRLGTDWIDALPDASPRPGHRPRRDPRCPQ